MRPRDRDPRAGADEAPVVLEPGPWWTGRRLRPRRHRAPASRLPLWARLGVSAPIGAAPALWVAAVICAVVGAGLLIAAVLAPGRAG
ncbi:MAG: hypothetical protein INR64_00645 [Caulobacteraceae bacterium]|nr:hypothetical protein [Caulobacter sp.]